MTRNVASTCISVTSISRAFRIKLLEAKTIELFPDVSSTQPREQNIILMKSTVDCVAFTISLAAQSIDKLSMFNNLH